MVKEPDLEWVFIDATFIKAHQHSTGAASSHDEGIGKSVGGNTTKIHLSVDSCGYPVCFEITGGNVHDIRAASDTLPKRKGIEAVVADTAYGSSKFRTQIETIGAKAVIPRKRNSLLGNDDIDWGLYKYRHLVENMFARLKHFRAVATRFDKLKQNFVSVVALACAYIWLPM